MPNIKVSVPHQLGQDEARNRLTRLIAESREKFGDKVSNLRETWTGNVDSFSFSAMGFDVNGKLDVQPASVMVDITLPWAALPFKSRIETEIVKHARELLA